MDTVDWHTGSEATVQGEALCQEALKPPSANPVVQDSWLDFVKGWGWVAASGSPKQR
ncbi:hypothetical protein JZU46_00535 [bacterium]|nr:hypothetical protein [bacterium]